MVFFILKEIYDSVLNLLCLHVKVEVKEEEKTFISLNHWFC